MVVNHVGRLDRILAETASKPYLPDPQVWWLAPAAAERAVANVAEIERLRAMAVALECEVAALTDALAALTHRWQLPPSGLRHGFNHAAEVAGGTADPCWICGKAPDDPEHRTPARVRAELGYPA